MPIVRLHQQQFARLLLKQKLRNLFSCGVATVLCFSTGCTLLRPDAASTQIGVTAGSPHSMLRVHGQYRAQIAPGVNYATYEVSIENLSATTVVFTAAMLKGTDVLAAPTDNTVWAQFYPDSTLAPGETAFFQVCFSKLPRKPFSLELQSAEAPVLSVEVPPFRAPLCAITSVTFSHDFKRTFVQYASAGAASDQVRELYCNGQQVELFDSMCENGRERMLAFASPMPIATGDPVHVSLRFTGGARRDGIVRALGNIVIDSADRPEQPGVCQELGLDSDSVIHHQALDVACLDAEVGRHGATAMRARNARLSALAKMPGKLTTIHYCTASYAALWDIYGGISDCVAANPFALGYSHQVADFMEEELAALDLARRSAQPRPMLWMPYAFKQHERFLEAEELRTLLWSALLRGCKGLHYYTYKLGDGLGFSSCQPLRDEIQRLNNWIQNNQALLAPLAPIAIRRDNANTKDELEVATAWAGDSGVLIMVRNLDYQTDAQANKSGQAPRFVPNAKRNLQLDVPLPQWLNYCNVRELVSGRELRAERDSAGGLTIFLNELRSFALIWLENALPATAGAPPA